MKCETDSGRGRLDVVLIQKQEPAVSFGIYQYQHYIERASEE